MVCLYWCQHGQVHAAVGDLPEVTFSGGTLSEPCTGVNLTTLVFPNLQWPVATSGSPRDNSAEQLFFFSFLLRAPDTHKVVTKYYCVMCKVLGGGTVLFRLIRLV